MGTTYTKEQITRASRTALVPFLESIGEEVVKSGREHRLKRHDSLTISGNKWYRHSTGQGGDAIDFVRSVYGKGFTDAVSFLLSKPTAQSVTIPKAKEKAETLPPFKAPYASADKRGVFAYLSCARGIDRDVIEHFYKKRLIYSEARTNNVVFIGTDEKGTPQHASLRGTSKEQTFKGNAENSRPEYSFHHKGTSGKIYVFEAPIDMLSYISMTGGYWQRDSYVALCGVGGKALEHRLKTDKQLRQVVLCLDNDDAGQKATERLKQLAQTLGKIVTIEVPQNKDWNEDLTASEQIAMQMN